MDHRYLAATLAMIAMYIGLSQGFRSFQQSPPAQQRLATLIGAVENSLASTPSWSGDVQALLHEVFPREQEFYAEMPPPPAPAEVELSPMGAPPAIAERTAGERAARCARAQALRQAERARRDLLKARDQMARERLNIFIQPASFHYDFGPELSREIKLAALNRQVVLDKVRLRLNGVQQVSVQCR